MKKNHPCLSHSYILIFLPFLQQNEKTYIIRFSFLFLSDIIYCNLSLKKNIYLLLVKQVEQKSTKGAAAEKSLVRRNSKKKQRSENIFCNNSPQHEINNRKMRVNRKTSIKDRDANGGTEGCSHFLSSRPNRSRNWKI